MVYQKRKHVKREYKSINQDTKRFNPSLLTRPMMCLQRWKDLYVWFLSIRSTRSRFRYRYSTRRTETCRTRRVSHLVWRNVESYRRSFGSYRTQLLSPPTLFSPSSGFSLSLYRTRLIRLCVVGTGSFRPDYQMYDFGNRHWSLVLSTRVTFDPGRVGVEGR